MKGKCSNDEEKKYPIILKYLRPNLDDATSLHDAFVGAGRRPVQATAYTNYYSTIQNTYNDTHNHE